MEHRVSNGTPQGQEGFLQHTGTLLHPSNVETALQAVRTFTLIPPHLFLKVIIKMGVVPKFLSKFILLSVSLVPFL